tara:strand:+ start:670 stop:1197 length:528 start_codon:yes stop_codon:yes gene_type:complete
MKNKLVIFFIVLSFLFGSLKVQSAEKIVFVDLNFIFNNSSAGKKINDQIQKESKKNNSEFQEFKKNIDNDKEKLIAQKNVINKEEYQKKFLQLEKKVNEFNMNIAKKNDDLVKLRNGAKIDFLNKLSKILAEYSEQNQITMILKKENLLIGKTKLDVTKDVLDLFDKNVKKLSIK